MKTAEKRKIEQSMIYERVAKKEMEREGEKADGQVFVTNS